MRRAGLPGAERSPHALRRARGAGANWKASIYPHITMTQVSQVHLRFCASEDRLLLLIKTRDLAELRFWLTRRFVKRLWRVLMTTVHSNRTVQSQPDPPSRSAVVSFQHEAAIGESDFASRYTPDVSTTPLGPEAVLLARIRVKAQGEHHRVLCLHPMRGNGIELGLTDSLLHSLCKLLADAVTKTDWDLRLALSSARASPPGPAKLN